MLEGQLRPVEQTVFLTVGGSSQVSAVLQQFGVRHGFWVEARNTPDSF